MAAHRVPPQMMGIMPNNVGGLGMWRRLAGICYVRNELTACKKRFQELNNGLDDK